MNIPSKKSTIIRIQTVICYIKLFGMSIQRKRRRSFREDLTGRIVALAALVKSAFYTACSSFAILTKLWTASSSRKAKDADRFANLGLAATTVASGSWSSVSLDALREHHCVILQDNDEAGVEK